MPNTGQDSWEAEIEGSSGTSGVDKNQTPASEQTTETLTDTTIAAGVKPDGATVDAGDRRTDNSQQQQDTSSLFHQSTERTPERTAETGATQTGEATGAASGAATGQRGIVHQPNDLVMFGGKLTPWSQVEALQGLKPRYDQTLDRERKLEEQVRVLAPKAQALENMSPTLDALRKDPAGIAYIETLAATNDPIKAKAAMDAVFVQLNPVQVERVDPRLEAPRDENGDALPEDHPTYQKWYGSESRIAAITERQIHEAKDADARAERERAAKAGAEAKVKADAEAAANSRTQAVLGEIRAENLRELGKLSQALNGRGLDTSQANMTEDQWAAVRNTFADEVKTRFGIDVRSDRDLTTKVIQGGHIATLLEIPAVMDKIKAAAGVKVPPHDNAALGADRGPQKASEQTDEERAQTAAAAKAAADRARGDVRFRSSRRMPLQPGSPSETIPSEHTRAGRPVSDEEGIAEFEREIGG